MSRRTWSLLALAAAVLPALVLPVLITGAALVWRSRRVARGLAIALSVLALLGVLSIGVFLVPTVTLAWIAALGAPRLDAIVTTDNAEGVDFWRAEGFTHDDDLGRWSRLL